jgi:WhiB family transcriptional regulator, redox-sensing transcriptional regulator
VTRARLPRPHEVQEASDDPRLLRARGARPQDPTWRIRGRCRAVDPETFFPLSSEPAERALALCRGCDVQADCLAAALNAGDCEGVWGATTPRERRAMLVVWRNFGATVTTSAHSATH